MKILIVAASRHGSTEEIARALQDTLSKAGNRAVHIPLDEVTDISSYDVVVLGSAIYGGRWLKQAREFVSAYAAELQEKLVWLFSSGPVGLPLKPHSEEAVHIDDMMVLTGAREHKLFAGKLDRNRLNFAERALTHGLGVKYGDYRDWQAIEAWGKQIAAIAARSRLDCIPAGPGL